MEATSENNLNTEETIVEGGIKVEQKRKSRGQKGPQKPAQSQNRNFRSRAPQKKEVDLFQEPRADISITTLLKAGAHFGHQTSRWNPKMSPFIYTSRNGVHIIDLPKAVESWSRAKDVIVNAVAKGGTVLFVGTKKQAQEVVKEEAERCGAHFVASRWLGGMLTNFETIRKSVDRMRSFENLIAEDEERILRGVTTRHTKKERLIMARELEKLKLSLGGIQDMYSAPSVIFIIDIKREEIAVQEAQKLGIPCIALVDTNADPTSVDFPIPSNDDGTRSIRLFAEAVADAILEGKRKQRDRAVGGKAPVAEAQAEAAAAE